jgi:hypothetical protein
MGFELMDLLQSTVFKIDKHNRHRSEMALSTGASSVGAFGARHQRYLYFTSIVTLPLLPSDADISTPSIGTLK